MLRRTIDKTQALWCEFFHDQPMWPINGQYQCRTCLRYTAVPWEANTKAAKEPEHTPGSLHIVSRSAAASASR